MITIGLSRGEVQWAAGHGVPLENKRCQNERPDGTICGCPLSAHHTEAITTPTGINASFFVFCQTYFIIVMMFATQRVLDSFDFLGLM